MPSAPSISEFLHVVNAAQIYIACTTSITIWDWLACLPQEWKYIWKSKSWSPIKVLYCLVRYYKLLTVVVTDVWFFADWSESACAQYLIILPASAIPIDLSVELVLALRVYAIYGCDKRIGVFLLAIIVGFLGVIIAVTVLAMDYTRLPSWPGPCIGKPSIAGPKFITGFYAAPMTVDMIMTALTLYRVQNRGGSSSLMRRLVRDGLLYFFAITSLNLLNVIFFIQPNKLIESMNAVMSIEISSVLCCRLILNLRAENDRTAGVKKFSNTRGRWVTDIINESSIGEDGIQFSTRRNLPQVTQDEDRCSGPTIQDGIVIRFEQEVHRDNWKMEEHGSDSTRLPSV
ncbi:hypothetical protein C8R43DRAFT_1229204 [Mycena crocata]|nr:hypothetical protein C8R43DRAFT_1229204 [Mycena crocata]